MSKCSEHPQREAVTSCSACGKSLCADCIELEEDGLDFCYDCAVDRQLYAFKKKDKQLEKSREVTGGQKGRKKPSKAFIIAASVLVVLILAGAGLILYEKFSGGGGAVEVTPEQEETWTRDECMVAMEKVRVALNDYEEAEGEYPSSLALLAETGVDITCPESGSPYVYKVTGGGFIISCPNPEEHGVTALKASNAEIPHYDSEVSARSE